jgi:hypothetical protein
MKYYECFATQKLVLVLFLFVCFGHCQIAMEGIGIYALSHVQVG